MLVGIVFISGIVILSGALLYIRSKQFRESRAKKLINSFEFTNLDRIGFKKISPGLKEIYLGEFNSYQFAVFLDSDDPMVQSEFSIVFVVSYLMIDNETLIRLNNDHNNRMKSLILLSEYVFFGRESAQFRYANSLLKIPKGKLESKLNYISAVLKKEFLPATKTFDLETFTARPYE